MKDENIEKLKAKNAQLESKGFETY